MVGGGGVDPGRRLAAVSRGPNTVDGNHEPLFQSTYRRVEGSGSLRLAGNTNHGLTLSTDK